MTDRIPILKVLVGSRAHGLADENSDYDYRGVFVVPTKEHFRIGSKIKNTHWIEGQEDNTSWEVGHFLQMATQCNPTILEALCGVNLLGEEGHGVCDSSDRSFGLELQKLFPYIWSSKRVYDAFGGYAHNQQKKFMDGKDARPWKFAVAWLRTLWQGTMLLRTRVLPLYVSDPTQRNLLRAIKQGSVSRGRVVDYAHNLREDLNDAYALNPNQEVDLEVVNEYLFSVRDCYW
jgi:predicted nucleotidyltransferase